MKINAIYKISDNPLIWVSTGAKNWEKLTNHTNKKAYLLVHPMWFFSWRSVWLYFKKLLFLKRKNIELKFLHNSLSEYNFAKKVGFDSYFINHNIHVCEHKFDIDESIEKQYDAVYTAAAKPYKRLHLASEIRNLFVITYFWPDVRNKDGEWDLHAFEPKIKHAKFNRDRISKKEVNKILNQSYCGLALSKKEGAMFASMEYLLCGLPIVSTKSKGGRDVFFTKRNSFIVDDDPESVKGGVEKVLAKEIDHHKIREETLKLVNFFRNQFIDIIVKIYKKEGVNPPAQKIIYHKIWGNKRGVANIRLSK